MGGPSVTNAIKIGLVGCGGRGTGAVSQALKADPHAELTAVADVCETQIQKCVTTLKKIGKIAARVGTAQREFVGIDAFRSVINSDVDLVMLATPPGFRPLHLRTCVDAGKHIYCEKPVATDPVGVRSVLKAIEGAKAKNLCLMSGLCMRYNPAVQDMFAALSQGAIGRIVSYHATYFSSSIKPMLPATSRTSAMSDTEWQIRNWYNFVWLSGDGIVEQAIHSADRISWAMQDQAPLYCIGNGGCTVPATEGNIFDHFSVTYTYPSGVEAVLNTRQIDGCYSEIFDQIVGTDGTCTYGRGPYPIFSTNNRAGFKSQAKNAVDYFREHSGPLGAWLKTRAEVDVYQRQQNVLLEAIRENKPVNDGHHLAVSTLLAMMGRTAAYTGEQVSWEQMLHSKEQLVPEHIDWKGKLIVPPRAQPGRGHLE